MESQIPMKFCVLASLPILFSIPLLAAGLEFASPFTDNTVLQREMNVPIWGWGTPGTEVTIAFAGQERNAAKAKTCPVP